MLFLVCAYQYHLEVVVVPASPEHRPGCPSPRHHTKARRNGYAVLVAADGVPHQDLVVLQEEDEDEAMAAVEEAEAADVVALQGESPDGDTIGGVESWYEGYR